MSNLQVRKATSCWRALTLALALLIGTSSFIASAWAGWALKLGLNANASLVVALLSIFVTLRFSGYSAHQSGLATFWAALLAVVLALLCAQVHDLSFDGQQYHQQAALTMTQGWNPVWDEKAPVEGYNALWINSYAKGAWVYTALLMELGADIEAGKSFSLVLTLAAGLLVYVFAHQRLGLSNGFARLLALVAAFSPVVACQWSTLMNDHALGSLILAVLVSFALAGTTGSGPLPRWSALLVALTLALICTIKASGVVYGAMAWAFASPLVIWHSGRAALWRVSRPALLGLAGGVLLLGFNPYVTNTWHYGHPFYPLAGGGKVDIISYNAPPGVLEQGRIVKLFGSLMARSSSNFNEDERAAMLAPKVPGLIAREELTPFLTKSSVHIGGFGPWFSLALTLAAVGAAVALMRDGRRGWRGVALLAPAGLLFASALLFPEPWWARYVPQIWLVPLTVSLGLMWLGQREDDRLLRQVSWTITLVAAANTALVGALFLAGNLPRELDMRTQLASLAVLSTEQELLIDISRTPATALRLIDAKVRWREPAEGAECPLPASWRPIEYTVARVCLSQEQLARHRSTAPIVQELKAILGR